MVLLFRVPFDGEIEEEDQLIDRRSLDCLLTLGMTTSEEHFFIY